MLKHARILTLSLLAIGTTQAATETDTFNVTLVITETCSITAGDIAFGSEDRATTSAALTATGTLSVTCSGGTPYTIGLTNGGHFDSGTRRMSSGSAFVPYGLFLDNAYTNEWVNDASNWYSGTGNGSAQAISVYGRVPANGLNYPAGSYSDTITATITY